MKLNKQNFSSLVKKEYLHKKYVEEKLTIEEIGKLLGKNPATIRYYFKKYKILTRRRGPKDKYLKKPFIRNLIEKAYLIGIKCGDFYVYKEYNCIVVSITTTHPAMLRLFQKLFSKYGQVKIRPLFCKLGYEWGSYCRLDSSFAFLMWPKENGIPEWIKNKEDYFLSFLAGYFDAEGHISITKDRYGRCRIRCQINSKDHIILEEIKKGLKLFRISANIRKGKEGIWRFDISKHSDAINFLKKLPLQHEEKIMKRALALSCSNKKWEEYFQDIQNFKTFIKREVRKSILTARKKMEGN